MSEHQTSMQDALIEAERLKKQGDANFRGHRMTRAYELYSHAIACLEPLWRNWQSQPIGLRLADLYVSSSYPAWRKSAARSTADRETWRSQALERERHGVDLSILVARLPERMTDEELVGIICHINNLAATLLERTSSASITEAEHYINQAYSLVVDTRPGDTMPPVLHFGFQEMRARIAFNRGEYETALSLIEPVIAREQERVNKQRRRKKKLPPPNWLKNPMELRQKILDAVAKG